MAQKQALVIGLGQFGMSLAHALARRGVEVLAIDTDPEAVQTAAGFCAEALALDASDEQALAQISPRQRDLCVCAIGPESREKAIIATALLRQMGAPHIVARASDDVTERILKLVGAHEVVNPERAFGERLANKLAYEGLLEQVPLGEDLVITELRPPPAIVGRTLIELKLPARHDVTVVATRRTVEGEGRVMLPIPTDPIRADDILVVVARSQAVERFLEKA